MNTLTTLALSTSIVNTDQVFQALIPSDRGTDFPVDIGKFITVSLSALRPWEGDAFAGDTGTRSEDTSATLVQGDLQVTLWLRMQTDMFGRVKKVMDALGAGTTGTAQIRDLGTIYESDPAGQGYLVKLMAAFWDADPVGPAGTLILMCPLEWVGIEFPREAKPKIGAWFPFHLLWHLYFNWDLGLTLSPG